MKSIPNIIYPCKVCGKEFEYVEDRDYHMKTKHKGVKR